MTELKLRINLRRVSSGWAWGVTDWFGVLVAHGSGKTRVEAHKTALKKLKIEWTRRKQMNRQDKKERKPDHRFRFNWGYSALRSENNC